MSFSYSTGTITNAAGSYEMVFSVPFIGTNLKGQKTDTKSKDSLKNQDDTIVRTRQTSHHLNFFFRGHLKCDNEKWNLLITKMNNPIMLPS